MILYKLPNILKQVNCKPQEANKDNRFTIGTGVFFQIRPSTEVLGFSTGFKDKYPVTFLKTHQHSQ